MTHGWMPKGYRFDHGEATRNLIYAYLTRCIEAGQVPTQRDIARNCYLSQSSVHYHLEVMAEQKRIDYWRGVWRGVRLKKSA